MFPPFLSWGICAIGAFSGSIPAYFPILFNFYKEKLMYVITIGGTNTTRKMSMKKNTGATARVLPKKVPYGSQDWIFIIKGLIVVCTCKRLSDSFSITVSGEVIYIGSWKAFASGKTPMREFILAVM